MIGQASQEQMRCYHAPRLSGEPKCGATPRTKPGSLIADRGIAALHDQSPTADIALQLLLRSKPNSEVGTQARSHHRAGAKGEQRGNEGGQERMKTSLGHIGNKAKRTELYRKQKGNKKAEQKDRRRRREREAQELGEVSGVISCFSVWSTMRCMRSVVLPAPALMVAGLYCCGIWWHPIRCRSPSYNKPNLPHTGYLFSSRLVVEKCWPGPWYPVPRLNRRFCVRR